MVIALLAIGACGTGGHEHGDKTGSDAGRSEHKEKSHNSHGSEPSAVSLNDGKQWKANPATTTGIENMQALTSDFKSGQEQAEYAKLHGKLEQEFDAIIQKCTMKGEAHNQLHNYLMPLKSQFSDLKSDDAEERKMALENIREHLHKYGEYFR